MTYEQLIVEVFRDHHDCMGMDSEEIEDLMEEVTVAQMEKWLKRNGYDINELYNNQ
jgi:hypothetical protein